MGIRIETAEELQSPDKPTGFENVKNIIADRLQNVAEALGDKAADQGAQCGMAQYGKQASEWLDQSAKYLILFVYLVV